VVFTPWANRLQGIDAYTSSKHFSHTPNSTGLAGAYMFQANRQRFYFDIFSPMYKFF
jgi:hypothetical protein